MVTNVLDCLCASLGAVNLSSFSRQAAFRGQKSVVESKHALSVGE